ncbi:hypothetical protein Avbf_06659 [Armadillidium vulgare]|nr:hypothetical protein Avbf_06659 [Armadillidium vulgare]
MKGENHHTGRWKKFLRERINELFYGKPPTTYFMKGESDILNCSLLPDGLHGAGKFLEAFMRSTRPIFYQITGHDRYGKPVPKKAKTSHSRMLVNSRVLPSNLEEEDDEVVASPLEDQEDDRRTSVTSDDTDRCQRRFMDFHQPSTSHNYEEYHSTPSLNNVTQISTNQPQQETTWGTAHKSYTYTLPDYNKDVDAPLSEVM